MKILRFIFIFFFCLCLASPAYAASESPSALVREMNVNCGACLLEDLQTNRVLYGQDHSARIYPASVTKVLTALVVLNHVHAGDLSLRTRVTASDTFTHGLTADASSGNIKTGERFTVEQLLYMLLLPSHCDAANVLAEAAAGSLEDFGEEMNQTAQDLGCTGSHFVNPSGLHDKNHYTTCDDLYRIAKAAYQYDTFRKIISTAHYTVPATNLSQKRSIHSTNALICSDTYSQYLYDPCVGGKTGTTNPAGRCLLSFAKKDGRTLCCVMMGCDYLINEDGSWDLLQFSESKRLFEWGFDNFVTLPLIEKGSVQASVPVKYGRGARRVELTAAQDLSAVLPKDLAASDFTFQTELPDELEAPIRAGETVGTLTLTLNGISYGSVPLQTAENISAMPRLLTRFHHTDDVPESTLPPISLFFAVGAVALLALLLLWRHRHRNSTP